jgi:isopenicillin N synthase-like dioxygenase
MVQLHLVNLAPFWTMKASSSDERESAAAVLASACEKHGMFYVTCPDSVAACSIRAFQKARSFFSLPPAVKLATVPTMPVPSAARGYLDVGAESGGTTFERKEAFSYALELARCRDSGEELNALQAPNIWPRETQAGETAERNTDSIRSVFETFLLEMSQVALALARAFAVALDAPELEDVCREGVRVSLMRCNHYLPAEGAPGSSTGFETGSSQHTDWSLCTVIALEESPNSRPALQLHYAGEWWDVPPRPGFLVVNCGDFMALRSKGRFQSPWHRVNLTSHERTSFVYFQYPGYETPVPPIETGNQKLSLLENQARKVDHDRACENAGQVVGQSYGDFIALKWKQVARFSSEETL